MITPKDWGPHGWKFLHYITANYPVKPNAQDKLTFYNFFIHLQKVLPCEICSNNFKDHLLKYPLDDEALSSRDNFMKWLINIHNEANKSTGKKIIDIEYAKKLIINKFDKYYYLKKYYFIIPLIILFIVLLFYNRSKYLCLNK